MHTILATIRRYCGASHPELRGVRVVVVGVVRGREVLRDALMIGALQAGDLLEVLPIVDRGRGEELSELGYQARHDDFGDAEAMWTRSLERPQNVVFEPAPRKPQPPP